MAASPLKAYINRSLGVLRQNSAKVLRADALPQLNAHTIWSINSSTDLTDFATGSDIDIGGLSTCTLDKDEEGNGRFWGEMKTSVQQAYEGKVRGGYAGFRNKALPTLFGPVHHDLSVYTHLAINLRPSGEPQTLKHWFVNIQTDGPVRSDLFQHRLPIPTNVSPTSWITLNIPLSSFVLTNSGSLSETQIPMMTSRVRTVGLSLLGGGREALPDDELNVGVEGRFELGIKSIQAVHREEAYGESSGVNKVLE